MNELISEALMPCAAGLTTMSVFWLSTRGRNLGGDAQDRLTRVSLVLPH